MENSKQIVFRDLKAEEIEVKKGKGATLLLYKTARVDANILDETFGTLGWQKLYEEIDGKVYCKIGVQVGSEWIWKMDCGEETAVEAAKGEASDAMKRAGFAFGIGRKLYTAPFIKDPAPDDKYAKYKVLAIEFDDKKITSLCIVNNLNQSIFNYGDFIQLKATKVFDHLNNDIEDAKYYADKYGEENIASMRKDVICNIYYELKTNGKL